MSKYKVGDKVVIRKDLVGNKRYGGVGWMVSLNYLKEQDYVVLETNYVGDFGDYRVDGWYISDEMIECLYK